VHKGGVLDLFCRFAEGLVVLPGLQRNEAFFGKAASCREFEKD
jgi:hypothetical protein